MKKALIIASIVIVALFITGYYTVDYLFSEIFIGKMITGSQLQIKSNPDISSKANPTEASPENATGQVEDNQNTGENNEQSKPTSPPAKISAAQVVSSPVLMSKLEKIVSSRDKAEAMHIVMSCFSKAELSAYSKLAKDGLSSEERSQISQEASRRLTGDKRAQLMQIVEKYLDQLQ